MTEPPVQPRASWGPDPSARPRSKRMPKWLIGICTILGVLWLASAVAYPFIAERGMRSRKAGITLLSSGQPALVAQFCPREVIGLAKIRRTEAEDGPIIWSARILHGRRGLKLISIGPSTPGYAIRQHHDQLKGKLVLTDLHTRYGRHVLSTYVHFDVNDLRVGKVLVDTHDGKPTYESLEEFRKPVGC